MSRYLTAEEILNKDDFEYTEVPVPEWGGVVRVRGLSGAERDRWEARMIAARGREIEIDVESWTNNARATLVAMCVVDEHGKRLFTDDQIKLLGQKNARALDRVYAVAQRLSGITKEDLEELKGN